jgi:tRNA-dihydrouridine synthase C
VKTWLTHGKQSLFLAPMEGVTDGPMRLLLTEICPFTHAVTEFMRISQEVPPKHSFIKHALELEINGATPSGTPVMFQLLGGNAERLALSAARAVQVGAVGVDLNFGCPAPTVNRHDGGATLLKFPERIFEIVSAVRAAVPPTHPVSVKMRLGWDTIDAVYRNAEEAERAGASWITIHGRTKVAGYTPPAYWKPIGEVKKSLKIPVVANGEIWTIDDFKRCRDETQCEHFMLGRGVLANPFLAWQVAQAMDLVAHSPGAFPTHELWRNYLERKIQLCTPYSTNPHYAISRIKQWLRYVNSKKPFEAFDQIKRSQNLEELRSIWNKVEWMT